MLLEIAQEARDKIAAQPGLYKDNLSGSSVQEGKVCTCVGLALIDAAFGRRESSTPLLTAFLVANDIPVGIWPESTVYAWNDRSETTHAEAVVALDKLVDYLRTTEGQ